MRVRWWSTFNVLGIILIALSVVGFLFPHFVFDPGQPANHKEPWYYLVIGALMILNGVLTPPLLETKKNDEKTDAGKKEEPLTITASLADPPQSPKGSRRKMVATVDQPVE